MPKGRYPSEYFQNPNIDKPIEAIYEDIDAYTAEYFENEPELFQWLNMFIILPPLFYEGQLIKGLFYSQAVDIIVKRFPEIKNLFNCIAYNMNFGSHPWSTEADGYLVCYNNQHRINWFKQKKDIPLLTFCDADYFLNEYQCIPYYVPEKDIDVILVSRLDTVKNLPVVAKALKIYNQKYNVKLKTSMVMGKAFDVNFNSLNTSEKQELREIEKVLTHVSDYITWIPKADYFKEIPWLYSRSKVYVLGSLLEGKNRGLHEAMFCNTPVITFKQFNQYTRGNCPAFPEGAGMMADEFDGESLADTIYEVINNQEAFSPRKSILSVGGRKRFFDHCINDFPYYNDYRHLIDAEKPHQSLWLDLAMVENYQLSLIDFIYDKNCAISHLAGVESIGNSLKFFFARFGLPPIT